MKSLDTSRATTTLTTKTVRSGLESDAQHGAVMPPIYLSSNYTFEGLGEKREYDYTRSGNPTRDLFARALTDLEGAAGAVVTSSGMSAIALFCHLPAPGDVVVVPHDGYGGSHRLFSALDERGVLRVRFVDYRDAAALAAVSEEGPAWFWIETPSNPLMRLTDIESVVELARDCDAQVAVDNTFMTPLRQRPVDLGADVVVHSTTKYVNGHSDVVGGVILARSPELHDRITWWANCLGVTGAPFDSYLSLRGLRTLEVRLAAHEANAARVARHLAVSPHVTAVHWPGFDTHPDHDLARRQQSGFGAMLSFELAGDERAVAAFVDALESFSLAESLGGVESLVAHPASMTHAAMSEVARERAGISNQLIRLSVGIEDCDDLIADLDTALERVGRVVPSTVG